MKALFISVMVLVSIPAYSGGMNEKFSKVANTIYSEIDSKVNVKSLVMKSNSTYKIDRNTKVAPDFITEKDKVWRSWKSNGTEKKAFIKSALDGDCAKKVKMILKKKRYITEVFIMDKLGATICAYPTTSDYDQGDEDKWFVPFTQNKEHISKAEKDQSSGRMQAQVSIAINEDGKSIGVITIGVRASK